MLANLKRLQSWYSSLDPERLLNISISLQMIVCVVMTVLSSTSYTSYLSTDSPWYYMLQLAIAFITVAIIQYLRARSENPRLVKGEHHVYLTFLSITMLLCLVSAMYFMFFTNEYKIHTDMCNEPAKRANHTIPEPYLTWDSFCSLGRPKNLTHAVRTAVFVVVEILVIHTTVTKIIRIWSDEVSASSKSKKRPSSATARSTRTASQASLRSANASGPSHDGDGGDTHFFRKSISVGAAKHR
eukprot:Colp12_sorted_trinity150504_noHs@5947